MGTVLHLAVPEGESRARVPLCEHDAVTIDVGLSLMLFHEQKYISGYDMTRSIFYSTKAIPFHHPLR